MAITDRRRAELADKLRTDGIRDERVLAAIAEVPRHEFVPDLSLRARAYDDTALPIRMGQTISQPYTVAYMTALLDPQPDERVLEIGTGSGYQAAVLASLGARVFSVERHRALLQQTNPVLKKLGYRVRTRHGDGMQGWSALAPFDAIIVTAAGEGVPPALTDQLRAPSDTKPGGRLIIPVKASGDEQQILCIRRTGPGPEDLTTEPLAMVQFVPLLPGTTSTR